MTDGVHPAMDAMKRTAGEPMVDCVLPEPEERKLPASDHAVLPCRELRDGSRGGLPAYLAVDPPLDGHDRIVPTRASRI
ncbi:MAG: hypothetical protein ACJ74D_00310 [Gaiellaceae bacterium]